VGNDGTHETPQSPEAQAPEVRDALQQRLVSHEGTAEPSRPGTQSAHLGGTETEVTPIQAPMAGPGNLVGPSAGGDSADDGEDADLIDPVDEITPG